MSTKRGITIWIPIVASLAFYVASLGLPALEFKVEAPVKGMTTLLLGWLGILGFDFPWLANPLYFTALVLTFLGKLRPAQIFAVMAVALGATSVFVHEWYFNEANSTPVLKLGVAFYVWMASFVIFFIGITVARSVDRERNESLEEGNPMVK